MKNSLYKLVCCACVAGTLAVMPSSAEELKINAERLQNQESLSLTIGSMEVYTPAAKQYENKHGHITGVAKTHSVDALKGSNHMLSWGGKSCDPLPDWMVNELVDAKKSGTVIQVRYSNIVGQKTKCIVGMGWY